MDRDSHIQWKAVCFSGSYEKQRIQWDDQGNSLYSFAGSKYLKNLDILVADYPGCAVVVVSAAGKLHFRYILYSPGILVAIRHHHRDRQGDILTSGSHCLDQDVYFIRYIHNFKLQYPVDPFMDSRDNLYSYTL